MEAEGGEEGPSGERARKREMQVAVEARRRNVIGRARFVYLFARMRGGERGTALLVHANRQLGYRREGRGVARRGNPCEISKPPSRRFLGNFYTRR